MEMLRLDNATGLQDAWDMLYDTGSLFASFAAQGSHLPLLVVRALHVSHYGYEPDQGYRGGYNTGSCFVSYLEYGKSYVFELVGDLSVGYVAAKLDIANAVDALHITAFLNALGQPSRAALDKYLARLVRHPHDSTALDFYYYQQQGGPR